MRKVWFITGATRGIGAEIAKAALAAGNQVVATGRKPEATTQALGTSEDLLPVALDVTREEQVKAAVQAAIERFGRIDVLVNNAGFGHLGVFEESMRKEIRAQFETNVFGLMAVTQAVIPGMRERRSGRIFNISSVSGLKASLGHRSTAPANSPSKDSRSPLPTSWRPSGPLSLPSRPVFSAPTSLIRVP